MDSEAACKPRILKEACRMRFIHTGDWHLGRLLHSVHLTDDQRFTLEGLVSLAKEIEAEAVVVAGDVFDRAVPPTEAVELLDDVLAELVLGLRVPVVMIAGNHDSPIRLQYLSGLVSRTGVHVVGQVAPEPRGVALTDDRGHEFMFWPLAYTDPETARSTLGRDDLHTHESVLAAHIASIRERLDPRARHVLVGHAFVRGGAASESERPLTVGGTGEVSVEVFDGFDYVALGHLHRPQKVSERVRYAGSLFKYSFDEADDLKSVTVVELGGDGALAWEERRLPVRRDLARVQGSFAELMRGASTAPYQDSYLEITLTDPQPVLDAMDRLRSLYPNILSLRREAGPVFGEQGEPTRLPRNRTTAELFAAFFTEVTGAALSEAEADELKAVVALLERQRREV
jgi:exonuclease SbcD